MPSGFRLDTDAWLREYDTCKDLTQDVLQLIQERNLHHPDGGPEASRMTAAARRKLGTLGTNLDRLASWVDSPEAASLSEQERFRRRDLLAALKNRREQILTSLKRVQLSSEREALFTGSSGRRGGNAARETEATAELDGRGLLQLQEQVMRQQDRELEDIEKAVVSTKVRGWCQGRPACFACWCGSCAAWAAMHLGRGGAHAFPPRRRPPNTPPCNSHPRNVFLCSSAHCSDHWRGGGSAHAAAG